MYTHEWYIRYKDIIVANVTKLSKTPKYKEYRKRMYRLNKVDIARKHQERISIKYIQKLFL